MFWQEESYERQQTAILTLVKIANCTKHDAKGALEVRILACNLVCSFLVPLDDTGHGLSSGQRMEVWTSLGRFIQGKLPRTKR
jgi:hypothetical protein